MSTLDNRPDLTAELERVMHANDHDLKNRLLCVHLANASDTRSPLTESEQLSPAWGIARGVLYAVCCWVIIVAIYLMLTAGG
jgi:hypothetical protein